MDDTLSFKDTFIKHADFTDKELINFFALADFKKVKKNTKITEAGDLNVCLIYIKEGYLMTSFTDSKGQSRVIQFGMANWWTGDLAAFTSGRPSFYSIKTLTDASVYLFKPEVIETETKKNHKFERYFRKIFQNALVSHQKRIIRNISYSAEEKYHEFNKLYQGLELTVPQKYIASYLGITPEFLSKIRHDLRYK